MKTKRKNWAINLLMVFAEVHDHVRKKKLANSQPVSVQKNNKNL